MQQIPRKTVWEEKKENTLEANNTSELQNFLFDVWFCFYMLYILYSRCMELQVSQYTLEIAIINAIVQIENVLVHNYNQGTAILL